MSVQNAIVKTGATGITVTAGTDLTLTVGPKQVPGGINLIVAADADYRTRRNLTLKAKEPTLVNGVYSKDKMSIVYVAPKILADGTTSFNLIRLERETHPESTAVERLELLLIGAQLLNDSDFSAFWTAGSLA